MQCSYKDCSSDLCNYGLSIQDCSPNSDLTEPGRELRCIFPKIPTKFLDDITNGSLELAYSLVATSNNLHLMSQLNVTFVFVDDPVITPFNTTLSYQPGSNMTIKITVSIYMCVCTFLNSLYNILLCIVYPFRGQILMWLKTMN